MKRGRMRMANIEKRSIIDRKKLSGEFFFISLLQEARVCGFLDDCDAERIQSQCIEFLAKRCERYNGGDSSSIRVESAEKIMQSNLYTVGLYLKSLPDADRAAEELKTSAIPEMYKKGRELLDSRLHRAKNIYKLVQKNRINSPSYTYHATIDDAGLGVFFKAYDPDYGAHEIPASIDYQLCNPVNDLAGVEYIQQYLVKLFLENEFCGHFSAEDIHYLLCGYSEGYKDLLINIFTQVLTAALGCVLVKRCVVGLNIPRDEIQYLHDRFSKDADNNLLAATIQNGAGKMTKELGVKNPSLRKYIRESLPGVTVTIASALKTNTLDKVFVPLVNTDLKPKIRFSPGAKMADEVYRKLIDELLKCRYTGDKLALIKEKVKSFGDIEDLLFDAYLNEEEVFSVFNFLGDAEMAILLKRHPFESEIQAVDLAEKEKTLRLMLKTYFNKLPLERQRNILEIRTNLIEAF